MKTKTKLLAIFSFFFLAGMFLLTKPAHAYMDGCQVSFRASNGQYMVAESGGNNLVYANRGGVGSWETFTITNYSGGRVSFQTANGYYLQANNGGGAEVNAYPTGVGAWEKFIIIDRGGGNVALQTDNGAWYVVAESGGGDVVNANRSGIGGWETFGIVTGSGCTPPPPTCSGASPDGDTMYQSNYVRRTFADNPSNVTRIRMPTWTDYGGQDDIVWYEAGIYYGGGNRWMYDIPIADRNGTGNVNVHVYMYNAYYNDVFCDTANFNLLAGAPAPTIDNVTISAGTVTPNNSTQYEITIWASDDASGNVISHEYVLINYQGENGGAYRGYITWYWGSAWPGNIACSSSGGYAVVQGGYGSQYIYLDSCAAYTYSNTRQVVFTVRFDPSFTTPVNDNDISGYACASAAGTSQCTGWNNFQTNFNLGLPPTLSMTASPNPIGYGNASTVSWSTTNTTWCNVSGYGALNGSFNTGALTTGTTYSGTCGGAGGTVNSSVTVAVNPPPPPTLSMTASPNPIGYGNASTVSWSTTNTTWCNVSGYGALNGSFNTGALTTGTTYSGTCGGAGGTVNSSVTVAVNPQPPPTCSSVTPDGDTFLSTASPSRATTVNGVSGATSVSFPTWSESGGQDDIIWYPGTNLGGGVWRANISTASHPGIGNIYVHVYAFNPSYPSGIFCDSANFLRLNTGSVNVTTNASASWTINYSSYPGYGPWAGSGTSGAYAGVPYGIYTLTPAAISGYTSLVTPSVTQTLQ